MIAHVLARLSCCVAGCLFTAALVQAQLAIPTGGAFSLNGGALDLAGTDLQVAGAFSIGAGDLANVRNVSIAAGGNVDGGSGRITLFGDWSDLGAFLPASGAVNFVDGGASPANISGSTSFYDASFVSASGKSYSFAVGSTQTVAHLLTILGTPALAIQFRSSAAGQVAFIDLSASGAQNIQFVGVSDVHATGQHLAPNESNDGGSGNALGWFGSAGGGAGVVATPTLTMWGLLLLALLLIGGNFRRGLPRRAD